MYLKALFTYVNLNNHQTTASQNKYKERENSLMMIQYIDLTGGLNHTVPVYKTLKHTSID